MCKNSGAWKHTVHDISASSPSTAIYGINQPLINVAATLQRCSTPQQSLGLDHQLVTAPQECQGLLGALLYQHGGRGQRLPFAPLAPVLRALVLREGVELAL